MLSKMGTAPSTAIDGYARPRIPEKAPGANGVPFWSVTSPKTWTGSTAGPIVSANIYR